MKVLIGRILVGDRRREELGDLEGLAESIRQFGLLHPVVVDDDLHLIAGERRLRAMEHLGWTEVEVRPIGTLSEAERRQIELEENTRRKDLTEYERSRNLVELAATAAVVLKEKAEAPIEFRTESVQKSRGRPPAPASERRVAEHIGIPKSKIQDAQAHVQAADEYPVMQSWKQYHVLEAREALGKLPDEQRQKAVALVSEPGIPPKDAIKVFRNISDMASPERDRIFGLAASDDSRDRDLAVTEAAKLPPMPDPRLTLLDDATRAIRTAARQFPNDPANGAINAVLPVLKAAYLAVQEHSHA